ncbi:MAG TPA: glycerol acyltransferase [Bacteroidales bacterium]|nr:glycerol acyltransferase [Bacteroidales bacterium]HCB63358.1 glycerol acyltransferase [Bacteroidales bacterium]HCY23061.1 glycerol acyltransferase [Bacteroidales bacterium]
MEVQSNRIENGSLIISERTIDVRQLVRDKNPRLERLLPGCIIRYLRKILHEKEINETLFLNREKKGIELVNAVLKDFGVSININGIENLNSQQRFLLVANHPLGGLDGLALIETVGRVKPPIRFPVNDFLLYLPNMRELFIPINKVGGQSSSGVRALEEAFASNDNILYFPAGLASRKIKGKIVDLEWKKTFVQKARQHQRAVIPVHVSGQNSKRFYRIANWRKRLGIKLNIEMMFLSDEMYRQKGQTITITFGNPIPYTFFDKSKKDIEWADFVKQIVYSLPQND